MMTMYKFLSPVLVAAVFAGCSAGGVPAQSTVEENSTAWKDTDVPPPPAYSVSRLIGIDMPAYSSIKLGIDPDTLRIDRKAQVVRYVVVARGRSALNASYEGIHCATGEYRVYAHQIQHGAWVKDSDSDWKAMQGQGGFSATYPYELARNGLCVGSSMRSTVDAMVRELRTGNSSLYR
jgi:hypothetical protein